MVRCRRAALLLSFAICILPAARFAWPVTRQTSSPQSDKADADQPVPIHRVVLLPAALKAVSDPLVVSLYNKMLAETETAGNGESYTDLYSAWPSFKTTSG